MIQFWLIFFWWVGNHQLVFGCCKAHIVYQPSPDTCCKKASETINDGLDKICQVQFALQDCIFRAGVFASPGLWCRKRWFRNLSPREGWRSGTARSGQFCNDLSHPKWWFSKVIPPKMVETMRLGFIINCQGWCLAIWFLLTKKQLTNFAGDLGGAHVLCFQCGLPVLGVIW